MCNGGRGGRPLPSEGRPLPTFPFAKSGDQQFAKPCNHAIDPLAVRIGDAGGDSGAHIDEERIDDLLVLCIQRILGAVEQAEPKRFLPKRADYFRAASTVAQCGVLHWMPVLVLAAIVVTDRLAAEVGAFLGKRLTLIVLISIKAHLVEKRIGVVIDNLPGLSDDFVHFTFPFLRPHPGDTVSQGLSDVNRKSSPEGVENELLPFAIAVRLTM